MNMLSYWFFFIASVFMLSSFFVQTVLHQVAGHLSAIECFERCSKVQGGMDLWLISMALFVVSSLLGGFNYITTILNMRTKGMSMTRLPLTVWALFFTAILGYFSFPVLLSGFVLLIFDRNFGTSFYLRYDILSTARYCRMKAEARSYTSTCSGSWATLKYISSFFPPWECFGNIVRQSPKTHLRLLGDDRFIVCHYGPGLPRVGAPYVRNGFKSVPGFHLRIAHPADRGSFCGKSIQLAHDHLARQYPLYAGNVICPRFCVHVYLGWTYRYLPWKFCHRHSPARYLFRCCPLPHCNGCGGIFGMFAGIYHWFPKCLAVYEQYPGLYPLLGDVHRRPT